MSLNLPYPSIVFVPLDVLTAEELNEMAQNTNYIADQFPLKSTNIDWSSSITPTGKNVINLGSRKIMWGEINDSWTSEGHTKTINLPENFSDASYTVTFGKRQTGSKPAGFDQLNVVITSQTASNFNVQVWNNVDYALQFALTWLAIG